MKKGLKYISIFVAGLILLLVLLLLATQTAFFKQNVNKGLVKVVESKLNLKVDIEKLEGNFYNNLKLKNIRFTDKDSTVAVFSSIYLEYDLWELIGNVIQVDSLLIQNPEIKLWQKADSTWNLNSYLIPTKQKKKKSRQAFNFAINAKHLAISNGNISVSSFSKLIPNKMQRLNLVADGLYNKTENQIQLKNLEFETINPDFVLNQLSGICTINSSGIQLDSLLLLSGGSNLNLWAQYVSKENMNALIDASRIDNKELALFVPSLKLLCSPSVKTDFKTVNDTLFAQAEIEHNKEVIKADITLNSLNKLIEKNGLVSYSAALNFTNFNIENWIETNNNDALVIGDVLIEGTNLLDIYSPASITAKLHQSVYNGIAFDTLSLTGNYFNDSIKTQLKVYTNFGDLQLTGLIRNVADSLDYEAQIISKDFNVTTFVPKLENTKVNGIINAEGRISDANQYVSDAHLDLINCSIYHIPIDSLTANANIDSTHVFLDSLQIHVPGGFVKGGGTFNLDALELDTRIFADITSVECIDSIIILPIKFDSVTTVTKVWGPVNNLKIGGDVEVWDAVGYGAELKRADAKYLVEAIPDSLNVHVNTWAYAAETGPVDWDTASVDVNYSKSIVDVEAFLNWRDTLTTNIAGSITLKDTMELAVSKFEVNSLSMNLFMPDTMQASIFELEKLEIENFNFKDKNHDDFYLSVNVNLSASDSNKMDVLVQQLNLKTLNGIINQPDTLKGLFDTKIELRGSADNPIIKGSAFVHNPEYGNFSQSSLETKFGFENQEGFAELSSGDFGSSFFASLNARFNAYVDSLKFVFEPPKEFEGIVVFDSVDLEQALAPFVPYDSLQGVLNGKVIASGDWENPLFNGELNVDEAKYLNGGLGIDYNHIKTSIVFDGNKIRLDTALVYQEGGLISLSGEVEFDSTIIKGNVTSSELQVNANSFFLTKHRNYEVLLDASTFVKTQNKKPEFGGQIKVIRSDVFLPAIMSDGKADIENDVPLLVEALKEHGDSILTVEEESIRDITEQKFSAYSELLTGRINVEIPRNTWIKSNEMRIELSGDVEIVKTGAYFEIFGNIDIVRGHYILYGRKLNLQESQIIFQGGEKNDPTLNIVAEYVYRGSDKDKRYLELLINGEMSDPDITFMLDGSEITETDGISILVFGATSDEIGYGGQNGLIGSVGSNAVANVLTSQLSRTLGTQLKLDMIEITATESWQSAAFVVGKYITNDIFVIYQRGFGEVDGDEITPETITIEYELNDNLFLRLQSGSAKESGVDLILKFEKGDKMEVPFKRDESRR